MQVYFVVHQGMLHNNNKGAELNWARKIKRHQNNKNVVKLVARLSRIITEGIFTSGGIRTTTRPKKSTELSMSAHPFYPSLRYQSQHFIMKKRVRSYASPWKKWVGRNPQPRSLWTITQRAEPSTAKSNDNHCNHVVAAQ